MFLLRATPFNDSCRSVFNRSIMIYVTQDRFIMDMFNGKLPVRA